MPSDAKPSLTPKLRSPQFRKEPGWKQKELGNLFSQREETGYSDLRLLSLTYKEGIIPQEDSNRKNIASVDRSKYLRVVPGDIADNTMRMREGRSAFVPMRTLELKVPPVPLTAVFAAAMFGVATVTPAATFVIPGGLGVAIGLALLAVAIALAGVVAFRANQTTVNPLHPGAASAVVVNGVYRFSRNPMYLGFLLGLAAWAVHLSNALAMLFLPAFVAYLNQFQIKPEERALQAKFGPAFAQYRATVRRWV